MCCLPCGLSCCGGRKPFNVRFNKLLEQKSLTKLERDIIQDRYVNIVADAEAGSKWVTFVFLLLTNIITIFSVFSASLLILDKSIVLSPTGMIAVFWLNWAFMIAVTLANKWLYSYSINKKYVLAHAALEKFYTEGYSFISGTSRYADKDDGEQFSIFCTRIENLKLKHVEVLMGVESSGAEELLSMSPEADPQEMQDIVIDPPEPNKPTSIGKLWNSLSPRQPSDSSIKQTDQPIRTARRPVYNRKTTTKVTTPRKPAIPQAIDKKDNIDPIDTEIDGITSPTSDPKDIDWR